MAKLRFGIKTAPQHTTYDGMLAVWQEADTSMPGSDFTEIWKHISEKG